MKRYHNILLSLGLIFISMQSIGQLKSGTVSIGRGATRMELTITMNTNTLVVDFTLSGPASRWSAFGFGTSSMSTSAYTLVANVSSAIPKEYNQANHAAPILQSAQNLGTVVTTSNGGAIVYTFSRAMNTNDANDFVFTASTSSISIIWAYGLSTVMAQHASRGTTTITLSSICNIPPTNLQDILICQGDSALIFGDYETAAGNYYDSLQSVIGCDSVLMQSLLVGHDFSNQLADTNLCFGDSIQLFGNWVSQPGLYYDSLTSIYGCDSISSINVNSIQIDTQVYVSNNQLNAAYAFADHYQWYDCQTGQAISAANAANFKPLHNSSYRVEITSLGCMATSACHSVNWVGIKETETHLISLSPNPVIDILNINLDNNISNNIIDIYSVDGRKLASYKLVNKLNQINLSGLKSGLYIYQITSNGETLKIGRFIKQ